MCIRYDQPDGAPPPRPRIETAEARAAEARGKVRDGLRTGPSIGKIIVGHLQIREQNRISRGPWGLRYGTALLFKPADSIENWLAVEAKRLREKAKKLRPGAEREVLLRRARQAETGAHISEWLRSPGLRPPE